MKREAVEAVIYGCMKGLDGRITDCKLEMHAKCFHETQKSFILDPCSRQSAGKNGFDKLKSCCHHNVGDLCVHTDGAWLKKKKYFHRKDMVTIQMCASFV